MVFVSPPFSGLPDGGTREVTGQIPAPGFASPLVSALERRVGSATDATWANDYSSANWSRGYSFGPESPNASAGSARFATRFDDNEKEGRDDYFDSSDARIDDLDDPFNEQPKNRNTFSRGRSYTNPTPYVERDDVASFKSQRRNTGPRRGRDDYAASPFDDSRQIPSWERRGSGRTRDSFDEDLLTYSQPNADGGRFSFTATRDATVMPSDYRSPSPARNESFRFKGRSTPQMDADLPSLKSSTRRPSATSTKPRDAGKGWAIALYDFAGAEVRVTLWPPCQSSS
jgi:hypothetical protein